MQGETDGGLGRIALYELFVAPQVRACSSLIACGRRAIDTCWNEGNLSSHHSSVVEAAPLANPIQPGLSR